MIQSIPWHGFVIIAFIVIVFIVGLRGWQICQFGDQAGVRDKEEMDSAGHTYRVSISLTAERDTVIMRVLNLIANQQYLAVPSIAVVTDYYLEEAEGRYAKARPYVNYAMMLGLAGTIVGLFTMFTRMDSAISNAMSVDGQKQYFESLSYVIGSVKWAFISSLVGVLVSILLSYRLKKSDERQGRLNAEFQDWTIKQATAIWPKPLALNVTELQRTVAETTGSLTRAQDSANVRMDETTRVLTQLGESLTHLPAAMDQVTGHLRSVSDTARVLSDSMTTAAEEARRQWQQIENMQQDLLQTFGALMTQFRAENAVQMAAISELQRSFTVDATAVQNSMDSTRTNIDHSVIGIQSIIDGMASYAQSIKDSSRLVVDDSLARYQDMLFEMRTISTKLAESAATMQNTATPFTEIVHNISTTADSVARMEQSIHPHLEAIASLKGLLSGMPISDGIHGSKDLKDFRDSIIIAINMLVNQIYAKFPDETMAKQFKEQG